MTRRCQRRLTKRMGVKSPSALEAERFLHAVENPKDRGEFIDASTARFTVSQLGQEWLSSQTNLKPSSYRPVEIAWRLHVEPTWGKRAVGEIRHSQIQTWVAELSRSQGATTVLRARGVLAGILDVAVKDLRVSADAARGVNLPRKTGKKRVYLSHDQVKALADHAGDNGTMLLFLAYTGLR
jgi:integrase